jgi:hypothetical protein
MSVIAPVNATITKEIDEMIFTSVRGSNAIDEILLTEF